MGDFYVPRSKRELVEWIKQRYMAIGQCVSGLERKPTKQLYAIFYSLRKEFDLNEPGQIAGPIQQAH